MAPKIYTDEEFRVMAQMISPYIEEIIYRGSVHSGESGAQVHIVDLKIDKQKYKQDCLKLLLDIFNDAPNPEACLDSVIGIVRDSLNYVNLSGGSHRDDINDLFFEAVENTAQNKSNGVLTIPRLLEAFQFSFDVSDSIIQQMQYPPSGIHFLKVHADASKPTRDALTNYQIFARSQPNIPDLTKVIDFRGSILAFYRPAYNDVDPATIQSLEALTQDNRIPEVRDAIKRIANWLDKTFAPDPSIMEQRPSLPWLQDFLGKRRYEGSDTVADRLVEFLRKQNVPAGSANEIRIAAALQFDGTSVLPNPVAALSTGGANGASVWSKLPGGELLTAPLTRAHGDLHLGNIIYRKNAPNTEVPVVIDFGDYSESQSAFFDPLYLELNLLLKLLPLAQPEERANAYKFLKEALFTDPTSILLPVQMHIKYVDTMPIHMALECINELRSACERRLTDQRGQDYRRIFWITAVAVGLNYVRKNTIKTYEHKMFCLMYAAMALNNLLALYGVDFAAQQPPSVVSIPWVDKPQIPQQTSQLVLEDLLEELQKDSAQLVLILGANVHPVPQDGLKETFRERLYWYPELPRQLPEDFPTLLQLYREKGGDSNLRLMIRGVAQRSRNHALHNAISRLGAYPGVRVITFDWHEYGETNGSPSSLITHLHMCGHTAIANSIYLPEEFDQLRAPNTLLDIHKCSINWIEGFNPTDSDHVNETPPHVVLVGIGEQELRNKLAQEWMGIFQRSGRVKRISFVASSPQASLKQQLPPRAEFFQGNPQEFLLKLDQQLPQPVNNPLPKAWNFTPYAPQPVNRLDIINQIQRAGPNRHWMIFSQPGLGKSRLLEKLCEDNQKDSVPYVIVDFASDLKLGSRAMNIMHYLFEHFGNMTLPRYADYEAEVVNPLDNVDETEESYIAIWLHEFVEQANRQGRLNSNIYLCFDGCEMASMNTEQWLKIHAQGSTSAVSNSSPRWLAWKGKGIADAVSYINSPDAKKTLSNYIMIGTRREHTQRIVEQQWEEFQCMPLQPLGRQFVLEILLDLIEQDDQLCLEALSKNPAYRSIQAMREEWRARIVSHNPQDVLTVERIYGTQDTAGDASDPEKNLLEKQLDSYIKFCDGNVMAIVELIRHHLRTNFIPDSFPTKTEAPASYEAIFTRIQADVTDKIRKLSVDKALNPESYSHYFTRALLCRRLDRRLAQIVFECDSEEDALNFLLKLKQAQLFYDDFYAAQTNFDLSTYFLVSPSLHRMVLGYFSSGTQWEDVVRLYCSIIEALCVAIHNPDSHENRSRNVLDVAYYYSILYERGLQTKVCDTPIEGHPKDVLRDFANNPSLFPDAGPARLNHLFEANKNLKPSLPDCWF